MDSFEFNKFAGAILLTLLVTLGVGILAEEIYTAHTPERPGYEIAVADDEAGVAEAESEEVIPIGTLLAAADVQRGEAQARKCAACHTFDEGGPSRVGPNLWGIVGDTIATEAGFNYSAAMQEHVNAEGDTWTYENLDHFLANPRGFVPGTSMAFAGLRRPEERADLLAYLQTLSSNPVPFPAADDAATSGEAPEAAEEAAPTTTQ